MQHQESFLFRLCDCICIPTRLSDPFLLTSLVYKHFQTIF